MPRWEQFIQCLSPRSELDKPVVAEFKVRVTPVSLAGRLTQAGGTLTIDTAAPANQPMVTVPWTGGGNLPVNQVGRGGYVLFRYKGNERIPTRVVRGPFVDTFAGPDKFWYGT